MEPQARNWVGLGTEGDEGDLGGPVDGALAGACHGGVAKVVETGGSSASVREDPESVAVEILGVGGRGRRGPRDGGP